MAELIFLKLGGSLITDKTRPYTARLDKLDDLCQQIASILLPAGDSMQILLGHGSGSFGHTAAQEHGTRGGVRDARGWQGFAEVHYQAAALNTLVMQALHKAGLPGVAFPPSASVISRNGQPAAWDTRPLENALANGILPVIYGDVVFDEVLGGTILSTEDLFGYLAHKLRPSRILLAGLEAGVWADFPGRQQLLGQITPALHKAMRKGFGGAAGVDVTGGMESKVSQMLELVQAIPGLKAVIFSAYEPGNLTRVLKGEGLGTVILL